MTDTVAPGPPERTPMSRAELDALLGFPVSDEQWQCVSAPLEPFVIVAGAGTGKTAVMAARVLWLVASGMVREHEVLGLTFTNKAAAELAARVTELLNRWRAHQPADRGDVVGEPTIATYHSFARRLIDEQGLRVGIEPGARLLSGAAVAQLAFRIVCEAGHLTATRHGPSRVAGDVIRLDANLAEQAISTDDVRAHDRGVIKAIDALEKCSKQVTDVRETAVRRLELTDLVDELRGARQAVGGLDFSDHMRLCADLVRSSEELVSSLRQAYPVVLLDEYQDTSIAQRVILSTLFAGSGVTAVGDPMQAIYGWRSASVANIDSFAEHFGRGGLAPTRVLSVNRRSGTPILDSANTIAAGLRSQHPQVAELRPPEPCPGLIRAALLPTVADEQEWIVEQVTHLVRSGTAAQDIAVLGRANDQLAPLQRMLATRGVPASISGTAPLTSSPYAMAVLSTLRALADPADNTAVAALLIGRRWRIGPADLEALGSRARHLAQAHPNRTAATGRDGLRQRLHDASEVTDPVEQPSLLEAARDPGPGVSREAAGRLAQFLDELRMLQGYVAAPLADLVDAVVAVTGARVEADLAAGSAAVGDVGLAGLMQLVQGFTDADGRTGLGAFLAYLDAAEELDSEQDVDLPTSPGAVQLMTMHKAKGLEFPVVVLPHLCHGTFPGGRGSERWTTYAHVVPSELRDDRHVLPALGGHTTKDHKDFGAACRRHDRTGDDRLAYVGVTRAKRVLIASGHWWGATQKKPRGPSEYLQSLREHATDPDRDPWADVPAADASPTQDPCPDPGMPGRPTDPTNPMLERVEEVPWPTPESAREREGVATAAALVSGLVDAREGLPPKPGPDDDAGPPPPALPGPDDHAGPIPARAPGASTTVGEPALVAAEGASSAGPTGPGGAVARHVAAWDTAILALLARTDRDVGDAASAAVPGVLSASATMELAADPGSFAERLLRPMPRRRNRHAELGTAFHAWVEARLGVQPLITDDDLPGAADDSIGTPEDLADLKAAFERLDYAHRSPAGLEVPFSLVVAGRQIRGRIDAVFPIVGAASGGARWEVVDWKTSARDEADPLQLAIYRLAWAELAGVPLEEVSAAFVFVRSGAVVRPSQLADAAELARILTGDDPLDPV